jgi:maleylacetoacetate isomerase
MRLHGYFRSSAAYRVRIALNLKGLAAEHLPHHLRKGEQCAPSYLAINPQGLVPTLENEAGAILTQSLAIIEWLDETYPEPPLLPKDPLRRRCAPSRWRSPAISTRCRQVRAGSTVAGEKVTGGRLGRRRARRL